MRLRLLVASLAVLICCGPTFAADPPRAVGLDVVPTSSFGFVTVRVSDLQQVEALKPVREAWPSWRRPRAGPGGRVGLTLDEVDRVTLFWPALSARMDTPVVVVTTQARSTRRRSLRR